MNIPAVGIEPFYFGASGNPLFGCYHAPQSRLARDCGVVLCYPMVSEYIWTHRIYRQLAVRLARVGFHVLRFDYYGCGDSSGDCEQGGIRQWCTDIGTAVDEIRVRCLSVKVCLIGLRLGGSLTMMVGAERGDIDSMILWDPVVKGRAYVEELTTLHQERLRYSHGKSGQGMPGEKPSEALGFPLTHLMLTDLDNLDLLSIGQTPANTVLVIKSNTEAGEGRLREHLERIDTQVDYQHLPSPKTWNDNHMRQVPIGIIQAVVSWTSEVYS